jgi:CBS domain containing-hemolysin-like protein
MIIPESMTANNILKNFIAARTNMAVVVDEFGGTSGVLTREDLLEEIFGEIEDEHDLEDLVEKKLDTNRYEFSARLEIDYINENYGLSIPESDDYETLAGFILSHTESIPRVREVVKIGSLRIQILKVAENRIEQVLISLIEQE